MDNRQTDLLKSLEYPEVSRHFADLQLDSGARFTPPIFMARVDPDPSWPTSSRPDEHRWCEPGFLHHPCSRPGKTAREHGWCHWCKPGLIVVAIVDLVCYDSRDKEPGEADSDNYGRGGSYGRVSCTIRQRYTAQRRAI